MPAFRGFGHPGRSGLAHLFEHLLFHGVGAVNDYTTAGDCEAKQAKEWLLK